MQAAFLVDDVKLIVIIRPFIAYQRQKNYNL
jgi:hypothetical protein